MGELLGTGPGRYLHLTDSPTRKPNGYTKELRLVKTRDELMTVFTEGIKSVIDGTFVVVEFKPVTGSCEVFDDVDTSYETGSICPGTIAAQPTEFQIDCHTGDIYFAFDVALSLVDYFIEKKITVEVSDASQYPMRDNMKHLYPLDLLRVPPADQLPTGLLKYRYFLHRQLVNTDFSIHGRFRSAQYFAEAK